jgi:alpha-beta hydrolase superfamily lysophospholipase
MRTEDGVELFVRDWPVSAGVRRRGAALIVHGLSEHCGRYAHVAAALNERGVAVRGYDQRGFGQSRGPRATIPYRNALVDDAKLVFDQLAAEARAAGDRAPPFLIGHSMGGAVAARAVTGGWVRPRGLVLSSPALATGLNALKKLGIRLGSLIVPNLIQPHGLPLDKISHDPQVVAEARADPLNHDRITPRLAAFIIDAGDRARAAAAKLETPTLLLVAGDDRLVDARGSREFAQAAPAGRATLHWYDGLYHEVFNEREPDRTKVLGDLKAWVGSLLDK